MKNNAFTLIELLIVIAIAAIIVGVLIPLFHTSKQDAKIAKLLTLVDALKTACEQYHFDTGEYATGNDLNKDSGVQGWNGPYTSHPLVQEDNPFGGPISVVHELGISFDLDGGSNPDLFGPGNVLAFDVDSETVAQKINDVIDKDIPGSPDVTGKVQFFSLGNSYHVDIYLCGGTSL